MQKLIKIYIPFAKEVRSPKRLQNIFCSRSLVSLFPPFPFSPFDLHSRYPLSVSPPPPPPSYRERPLNPFYEHPTRQAAAGADADEKGRKAYSKTGPVKDGGSGGRMRHGIHRTKHAFIYYFGTFKQSTFPHAVICGKLPKFISGPTVSIPPFPPPPPLLQESCFTPPKESPCIFLLSSPFFVAHSWLAVLSFPPNRPTLAMDAESRFSPFLHDILLPGRRRRRHIFILFLCVAVSAVCGGELRSGPGSAREIKMLG